MEHVPLHGAKKDYILEVLIYRKKIFCNHLSVQMTVKSVFFFKFISLNLLKLKYGLKELDF